VDLEKRPEMQAGIVQKVEKKPGALFCLND
jgi:hypothetical protein